MRRRAALRPPPLLHCLAALLAAVALGGGRPAVAAGTEPPTPVRVLFLTDCTMYSNWQALGMQFSFKMSGQPGLVTRVSCCTDEERKTYDEGLKKSVETWIAPSMAINPHNQDHYAAYNKPEAVIDYMDNNSPREEYVLVLDSDMILRRPFFVEDLQPRRGLAVGARYTYLIGVNNELATRHIPQVLPRNDTLAGPFGRRADQVGGFFFIHRDDLKRMSHDWLKFSEAVRFDDQVGVSVHLRRLLLRRRRQQSTHAERRRRRRPGPWASRNSNDAGWVVPAAAPHAHMLRDRRGLLSDARPSLAGWLVRAHGMGAAARSASAVQACNHPAPWPPAPYRTAPCAGVPPVRRRVRYPPRRQAVDL